MFFLAGLKAEKAFFYLILLFLVWPFGNGFASNYYNHGLYIYDFFFISFSLILSLRSLQSNKFAIKKYHLFFLLFLFLYAVFSLFFTDISIYYLRDLRLIIFYIYIFAFIHILQNHDISWTKKKLYLLIVLGGCANILMYLFISNEIITFDDDFYQRNSFRYFDLMTYISSLFVIFHKPKVKSFLYYIAFYIALSTILISGMRFLIFSTIIVFIFNNFRNKFIFVVTILFLLLITLLFSVNNDGYFSILVNRILNVSYETIIENLLIRFGPFFEILVSFDWYNFVIGKGFGTVFVIPWFEYRESIDLFNNFVDSTYLTLFSKFGLFSLLYIFIVIFCLVKMINLPTRLERFFMVVFVGSIMLVYCLPYQSSSIGIMIGCCIINFASRNLDKEAT